MQCFLSAWLISLGIMISRFIRIVANGRIQKKNNFLKQHQNQASVITVTSNCQGQMSQHFQHIPEMQDSVATVYYPKTAQYFM